MLRGMQRGQRPPEVSCCLHTFRVELRSVIEGRGEGGGGLQVSKKMRAQEVIEHTWRLLRFRSTWNYVLHATRGCYRCLVHR